MMQAAAGKEHSVVFLEHFSVLEDPRQQGKVAYPLAEVLLLVLCAVLAGADSWVEIAKFGEKKLAFLRRFRPFENGTPSYATNWATSSPCSILRRSNAASSSGCRR